MFKFKKYIDEYEIFVEFIKKNNELESENEILYKALMDSTYELYILTGKIDKCNPEYFIKNVKHIWGL